MTVSDCHRSANVVAVSKDVHCHCLDRCVVSSSVTSSSFVLWLWTNSSSCCTTSGNRTTTSQRWLVDMTDTNLKHYDPCVITKHAFFLRYIIETNLTLLGTQEFCRRNGKASFNDTQPQATWKTRFCIRSNVKPFVSALSSNPLYCPSLFRVQKRCVESIKRTEQSKIKRNRRMSNLVPLQELEEKEGWAVLIGLLSRISDWTFIPLTVCQSVSLTVCASRRLSVRLSKQAVLIRTKMGCRFRMLKRSRLH